jgi:rhodanese-related sulfurtransferase
MKRYNDLIKDCLAYVQEIMPWDLEALIETKSDVLLLDIREPQEFEAMHVKGSINVPRGILEQACEFDYEETVPELVAARERESVVICRSGLRSVLAARTLQLLGFRRVWSLKTGLKGWNDYELPLVDAAEHPVPMESADEYFTPRLRPDQLAPQRPPRPIAGGPA